MSGPVVQPASGWLPDPTGRHQHRYWNGTTWTSAVADGGVHSEDAPQQWGQPAPGWQSHSQPQQPAQPASSSNGFWTTMPGVLTAIAGVITAIAGIFVVVRDSGDDTPADPQVYVIAGDLGVNDIVGSGSAYSGFMTVNDNSGTVVVDVPVEWGDVNGAPRELPDGSLIPDVAASTDVDAFLAGADVPGVEVAATDTSVIDVPTAMAQLAPPTCTSLGSEPYDDPAFTGQIEFYGSCQGTDAVVMVLAANYRPDPNRIALLTATITTQADLEAIDQILLTFNFR